MLSCGTRTFDAEFRLWVVVWEGGCGYSFHVMLQTDKPTEAEIAGELSQLCDCDDVNVLDIRGPIGVRLEANLAL